MLLLDFEGQVIHQNLCSTNSSLPKREENLNHDSKEGNNVKIDMENLHNQPYCSRLTSVKMELRFSWIQKEKQKPTKKIIKSKN